MPFSELLKKSYYSFNPKLITSFNDVNNFLNIPFTSNL